MNEPVGHPAPEPSFERLSHSVMEVVACVKKKDFTSKNFVHHVGDAIVQANAFRPDDAEPVFASEPLTSVDQCCDFLESEVAATKTAAEDGVEGFNPFAIWKAIKTLLALIELLTDDEGEST